MRRILTATLLTTAISSVAFALATAPALAQMDQGYGMDQADSGISLDDFSNQLAPYGYWLYSDRWGLVWQPADVSYDFRPYYSGGHWVYTDEYGWYWQSDFAWGDIPFHYGRWINDPDDGWMWIPGYTWSPGWVTWRSNGQYIGWMPMPPDDAFLSGRGDIGIGGGLGLSFRFGAGQANDFYGYSRWYGPDYNESRFAQNWVFVGLGQIASPDYRTVVIRDPVRVVNIIHQTRNVTNYTVVNNYVVNRSVDVRVVERAAGHPVVAVRAATVIRHPNLVATVSVGQRAQMRMRVLAPHGNGVANSAPPPPPMIVAKLSTRVPPPRAGHPQAHLFTKATVTAPEAQTRFRGPRAGAPGAMPGANEMGGPSGGPAGGPRGERTEGPNGGPGMSGQPTTGPGGERQRPPRPDNGMTGPAGGSGADQQPGGERQRPPRPDNGSAAPTGGPGADQQPGNGPGGERQRPPRPDNGMTGPAGGPGANQQPGGERQRPPRPDNGSAAPSGGPGADQQPGNGPSSEHQRPPRPDNGMTGPGPSGGPDAGQQPTERPRPPRPPRPEGSSPAPAGGPPAGSAAAPGGEPPQGTPPVPPHRPPPKKQPPQNPPQ